MSGFKTLILYSFKVALCANGESGSWFLVEEVYGKEIPHLLVSFSLPLIVSRDSLLRWNQLVFYKVLRGLRSCNIYVDDTLIFAQVRKRFSYILKMILYSFKLIFGLAINYSKSEVASIGPITFLGPIFASWLIASTILC